MTIKNIGVKIQYKKDDRGHRINMVFPPDFLSVWGLDGNTLSYNMAPNERPTNKFICEAIASIAKSLTK